VDKVHPVKCPVKSFAESKRKLKILFNGAILPKAKLFNRVKVGLKILKSFK